MRTTDTTAPIVGGPLPTFESFLTSRVSESAHEPTPIGGVDKWNSDMDFSKNKAWSPSVETYPGPWPQFQAGAPKPGKKVACYYDQKGTFLGWTTEPQFRAWGGKVEPAKDAQYKMSLDGSVAYVTTTGLYKDDKAHAWCHICTFDEGSLG